MQQTSELASRIDRFSKDPGDGTPPAAIVESGLEVLPVVRDLLSADMPLEEAERLEMIAKAVLRKSMSAGTSGAVARQIALFQKELGFIFKFKPYAVKASVPLGYSIFLQNPAEGFSFQQHIAHKVEVFHVLEAKPGGYVFLCSLSDWKSHYDPCSFPRWLEGEPHHFFDRCKFTPRPGDVFIISALATVHTVIGCVLEEFATISTDMVDRLHDQNAGKSIPTHFNREYAEKQLETLALPENNRVVDMFSRNGGIRSLPPASVPGGTETVLTDSFLRASHRTVEPCYESAMEKDPGRATFVRVHAGEGRIFIAAEDELDRPGRTSIPLAAGDLFMIPPGIHYGFKNETGDPLTCSEHRIEPEKAFI